MLFTDSNLPLVTVQTGGAAIPDTPKVGATMQVLRDLMGGRSTLETTPAEFSGPIGIELRGHASMNSPKKQYGIELRDSAGADLAVSLLGMPAESDWILQGPYRDKVMFRNAFAYELSNRISRYAVRTRFVEAFVDESGSDSMVDHYVGLYVLMEKIKRGRNRVDVQPLEGDVEPGVTGGWILKIDKGEGEPQFTTTRGTKILYEYPEGNDLSAAQRAWIKSYFDDFETALQTSGADITTFIDVRSFVDYFIINELMKNIDAYRISTYMYKDRGSPLALGPVWDFDLSSTTVARYGGASPEGWVIEEDGVWTDSFKPPFWWKRLLASEGFVEQLITRWRRLRKSALRSSDLLQLIDEWTARLDEAQTRNYERWMALGVPIGDEPVAFPTYAGEVAEFRAFVEARLDWIDANINWLLPAGFVGPDEEGGPSVTAVGPHVLDLVVRGRRNHELVHRYYNGIQWSGWLNLGGDLAAGPAITSGGPHPLDVFVRDRHNDELVHHFFDGFDWSGWINLGGDLASAPAVTADGPHILDVFVRGRHHNELVHRYLDDTGWSGWDNLGGDLAAGPAVTASGPHVFDVFVRGMHNDELVHNYFDGSDWSGWINLGGDLASAPAVTADGPHVLDVFVRGKHNDELVHRYYNGSQWSGWHNLGGNLAGAPAVTAAGPHVLDVFVRGKHNDELVHRYFNGVQWSGWINLGGDLA